MLTDISTYDCTQRLYENRNRMCTESQLWEKNPLSHRKTEYMSAMHPTFQYDTLPTKLSHPLIPSAIQTACNWDCCQCWKVPCHPFDKRRPNDWWHGNTQVRCNSHRINQCRCLLLMGAQGCQWRSLLLLPPFRAIQTERKREWECVCVCVCMCQCVCLPVCGQMCTCNI